MKKNIFLLAGTIVVLSLALAACGKAGTPASSGVSSSSTTAGSSASSDMTAGSGNAASSDDMAAVSENMSSSDDMASGFASAVKLMGTFKGQNEMKAVGTTVIENGHLKLREFSVSEGPDLHVYLAMGDDVDNGAEIGKIDLKSTEQSFDVTKEELSMYDTVLIYCQKAHVVFGKASLESPASEGDMASADASSTKLMGTFEGQNEMNAAGVAVIENGLLKLSGFSVSEGPDLHVYLAKTDDAANGTEIGKIDLKNTEQTFDVSKEELSRYDTVLIYCQKAHVIFGKASLEL